MKDKEEMPGCDLAKSPCCLSSCEDLAAVFRALGHPARLAILKQLASRSDACCGEIVEHLPLAQSTVSQHLQVLKEAGLLCCDTRGRNCHYLLNWGRISEAAGHSAEFWNGLRTSEPSLADETDDAGLGKSGKQP